MWFDDSPVPVHGNAKNSERRHINSDAGKGLDEATECFRIGKYCNTAESIHDCKGKREREKEV